MQALIRPNRYRWNSMSREERLKEAAMDFIRMCAEQGDGDSPRQLQAAPQLDPYPRASVASVARPMLPTVIRQGQTESSFQSDDPENSRVSKKPVMKRKVLRRTPDGEVQVTDESITSETESNNPSVQQSSPECENLNQRMYLLNAQEEEEECVEGNRPQSSPGSVCSWSPSEESRHQCSRKESQSLSSSSFEQDFILTAHPKSFILPKLEQLNRNRTKTDRVARYLEHKHNWESLRLPGEDPRKGVRWSIREQMLYKSELPPKAQPVYIPNNYLVPTEKKRSALRWGIRYPPAPSPRYQEPIGPCVNPAEACERSSATRSARARSYPRGGGCRRRAPSAVPRASFQTGNDAPCPEERQGCYVIRVSLAQPKTATSGRGGKAERSGPREEAAEPPPLRSISIATVAAVPPHSSGCKERVVAPAWFPQARNCRCRSGSLPL
ncbi:hydrolethalus syndrome protein 1 [Crotalus adamanteus]|uniref:Hydrolethalus syndrome protein 1 n=1 Tax=Crotalus adamanteus TaxID=8729 RepID=A0AAW1AZ13_CROAD